MNQEEREQELERLGSLLFTREEALLIVDGGDDAYMRGRLLTEAMLRESIISMARAGSSPAQTMAMKLLEDTRIKEV